MDEARIRAARNSSGRHPGDDKPEPEPEPEKPKEKPARREPSSNSHARISINNRFDSAGLRVQKAGRLKWLVIGSISTIFIIIVLLVWWGMSLVGNYSGINHDKYQAILLTNGEAYLGKLTVLNEEYLKLEDIFYLKPQTEEKSSEETAQDINSDQSVQLIKFGGEVQGPEDEMIIARDQVLYYQNLKTDGKASKAIEEYKKSN